eukprot:g2988.t1
MFSGRGNQQPMQPAMNGRQLYCRGMVVQNPSPVARRPVVNHSAAWYQQHPGYRQPARVVQPAPVRRVAPVRRAAPVQRRPVVVTPKHTAAWYKAHPDYHGAAWYAAHPDYHGPKWYAAHPGYQRPGGRRAGRVAPRAAPARRAAPVRNVRSAYQRPGARRVGNYRY